MRLVVVGGDAAGMSAASQVKRRLGDAAEVIVVEQGRFTSYSACGIPYWIAGDVEQRDDLVVRTPEQHRDRGLDVRTGTRATRIDPERKLVHVEPGDPIPYDRLLLATGAQPTRPDLPGLDAPNVLGVQTLEDGARMLDAIRHAEGEDAHAVVVGAGYIGVEMAEAMIRRGFRVTVLERREQPMSTVDPDLGEQIAAAMRGMGIRVECGAAVEEVEVGADGRANGVRTADASFRADVVVLGLGVRPSAELALAAGLPVGDSGGIRVDSTMRVQGSDSIWAAGDCVESWDRIGRRWLHVPLGTHANKQGLVAGMTIAGQAAEFPGIVRTAMTKVCDLEVARAGLGEQQAAAVADRVLTATIETTTRAGYMPGVQPMTVKLVADGADGRLLGGQIVGREGSAIRIDTCAIALWSELTAADLMMADLGYAPPYSSVWDPLQVAARRIVAQL